MLQILKPKIIKFTISSGLKKSFNLKILSSLFTHLIQR